MQDHCSELLPWNPRHHRGLRCHSNLEPTTAVVCCCRSSRSIVVAALATYGHPWSPAKCHLVWHSECAMIAMLQEVLSIACLVEMQSSCGKSSRLWPPSLPSGPGVLQKRAAMDAGRGQDGIECHHLEYGVIQFCLKMNTSNLAFLSMLKMTHDT